MNNNLFPVSGALSAANFEDRQKIAYKMKKEADTLHKYFIDKLETLKGCAISHSEGPLQVCAFPPLFGSR